jgi:copper(I)-binding protein
MMKCSIECKTQFHNPMMKMRNCRRCKNFRGVKLSFKEGRDNIMSMVVKVGEEEGGGVKRLFRRATS